jgi:predicted Zn finger-like uncharacterized protein
MSWVCPACSTSIHHTDNDLEPRWGTVYRCPVCHLELVTDPRTERLIPMPFPTSEMVRLAKTK